MYIAGGNKSVPPMFPGAQMAFDARTIAAKSSVPNVTVAPDTVVVAAADRIAVVAFVTEAMVVPRPERAVPAPGIEIYFV